MATIDSPIPSDPASLENHCTVTASPLGSDTTADNATAAPNRPEAGSYTAMCEDRFAGEMIVTVGGWLSGGTASVVVVAGRRVVVGANVVVVVEMVVDVPVVEVVVGCVVVEVSDPPPVVVVVSDVVVVASSVFGEHAVTSRSTTRPSIARYDKGRRVTGTPMARLRVCRRRDRRTSHSSVAQAQMTSVAPNIP